MFLVAFLALIIAIVFFSIRFGLDGDFLVGRLFNTLEKSSGAEINYSSARLTWNGIDTGRLTIKELSIVPSGPSNVFIKIPSSVITFRILPILKGSVSFGDIFVEDPEIVINKSESSTIGNTSASSRANWAIGPFKPYVSKFRVVGAKLLLGDGHTNTDAEKTIFTNGALIAKELSPYDVKEFSFTGNNPEKDSTGKFKISGALSSLGIFTSPIEGKADIQIRGAPIELINFILDYFDKPSFLSDGFVNLSASVSGSTSKGQISGRLYVGKAVLEAGPYYFSDVELPNLRTAFKASIFDKRVSVEISELDFPGLNASLKAELSHISKDEVAASITVTAANIDLNKISPYTPIKLLKPEDREKLAQAGLNGRILIRGGAWSGRIKGLSKEPRFEGALALAAVMDNVSGFAPGLGVPIKNASGGIDLNLDEAKFTDVRLTLGKSPIVINGWIDDLRGKPNCNLYLSLAATGADLDPILASMSVFPYIPKWIKKVHKPKGALSMTLRVIGPTADPGIRGDVELVGFGCKLNGVPLSLSEIHGALKFEERSLSNSKITGKFGSSRFEMSGSASLRNLNLTLKGGAHPWDIRKMNLAPKTLLIKNQLPFQLNLRGDFKKIEFSGKVNLIRNLLAYGQYIKKGVGIPLTVEISGFFRDGVTNLEEAYLIGNGARVSAKGRVQGTGKTSLVFHLPPRGVPTSALRPFISSDLDLKPGGRIDGHAVVKYSPGLREPFTINSDIDLNYVSVFAPFFYKPVKGFTGKIKISGQVFNIKFDKCSVGNSEFMGLIAIRGFDKPIISGNIVFSYMDFSDFVAPEGYEDPQTWGEWLAENAGIRMLARSTGNINLLVKKGYYYGHKFGNLKVDLPFRKGTAQVESWSAEFANGEISGESEIDIRRDSITPVKINFNGYSMSLAKLMLADPERVSVNGTVRASGNVEWRLTKDRTFNNGLYYTGKVSMRAKDGIIYKFEILSKIFSLLNLGSILSGRLPDVLANGLPYEAMGWRMSLFDDKWKIYDFNLFSDAARISASGMYITSEDRVDFLVHVSPLVGFDKIFSGLFGNLITKDGKILTTTFRIRGLSGSPDVRLESTEPFGINP